MWLQDDHLHLGEKVIERLFDLGFRISLDKCQFAVDLEKQPIYLLGYEMTNKSIRIPKQKIKSMVEFSCPTDLTSMQSFLGGVQYFKNMLGLQTPNSMDILFSVKNSKCIYF